MLVLQASKASARLLDTSSAPLMRTFVSAEHRGTHHWLVTQCHLRAYGMSDIDSGQAGCHQMQIRT